MDKWEYKKRWFGMRTARWLTKTDKDEVDGVNQEVSLSDAAMHSVAKWSIGDFKDEHVGGRAKSSPLTRYPMPCCLGQIRTMKIPERKIQNQQMSVIQNIKIWNVSIFWRALKSDWCQRNVSLYREIENSNTKLLYPQNSTFFSRRLYLRFNDSLTSLKIFSSFGLRRLK